MARKTFEQEFRDFIVQYEKDMRGDMSLGNGDKGVIGAIRDIQECLEDYPSLTWLLAHKPVKTVTVIAVSFILLEGLITLGLVKLLALL